MKEHLLKIIIKEQSKIILNQCIFLKGNYIIGRHPKLCEELLLAFNTPTNVICLSQANRYLSGLHCVLVETSTGYQIIDGWGEHKSTNGIYKNGRRIQFEHLFNGDELLLGSEGVLLKYEVKSENVAEDEKKTLSQIFNL